jgi:DNA-binding response OmpR family regulator
MLPHVNGFELLQAIRKQPGWQHTKVVMLSAKDQIADLKQAFALGADDYVLKPFDPEELLARVGRFLHLPPSAA